MKFSLSARLLEYLKASVAVDTENRFVKEIKECDACVFGAKIGGRFVIVHAHHGKIESATVE